MPKEQFNYTFYKGILMPFLPIKLLHNNRVLDSRGMVDSGAMVNVLPYQLGLELGAIWDDSKANITLSGNLANAPATGIVLDAIISDFPPIPLAFAWTKNNNVSLILGQMNFFNEFNICFYRDKQIFEVSNKFNKI